jgi:hypothetical protein
MRICPQCRINNPSTELMCRACGTPLRDVHLVDPLERLAGAQHSVPSVLYVGAVVASVGVGAITLYLIGEDRFLENLWLLVGGFMGGVTVSLTLFVFLISRWAKAKYGE